jgi:uncharacterized protein YraI
MATARRITVGLALAVVTGVTTVASVQTPAAAATFTGTVRTLSGGPLNVRSGPSTVAMVVGSVANGARVGVVCQTSGEMVQGSVRRTALWDRMTNGRYVSDAYIVWGAHRPAVPWCSLRGTVVSSGLVNQRSNASTLLAPVGTVHNGQALSIRCQLAGETVSGRVRRSPIWDRLSNGHFVSDAYVAWPGGRRPAVPWCVLGTGPAPATGAPFINWAARYARSTMRSYQVPASVTIAQAILESGWGRSSLTRDGNNFFGMKCFSTPGKVALGCRTYRTTECGTRCFATTASFRVYLSPWTSFKDHGFSLRTLKRYATAFKFTKDPNRFAVELQRAGYATSPTYASKLIALMKKYNLYRYDR